MRYDIKRLVAAIPLGELVGQYLKLKRSGTDDLVGLCPFHSEKSPSLHVHPEAGFFKCFGCGAGGDAISFYARIEQASTAEAIKQLAEQYGFDLGVGKRALPMRKQIGAEELAREAGEFWRILRRNVADVDRLSLELDVMICDTLSDNSLYHEEDALPVIELGWLMIRSRERWREIREAFHVADCRSLREKMGIYQEFRTPKLAALLRRGADFDVVGLRHG